MDYPLPTTDKFTRMPRPGEKVLVACGWEAEPSWQLAVIQDNGKARCIRGDFHLHAIERKLHGTHWMWRPGDEEKGR